MGIRAYPQEAAFNHRSSNFRAKPSSHRSLMADLPPVNPTEVNPPELQNLQHPQRGGPTHQQPAGLPHRGFDRLLVPGNQRPQVDELAGDPFLQLPNKEITIIAWNLDQNRNEKKPTFSAASQACSITMSWAPQPTRVISVPSLITWSEDIIWKKYPISKKGNKQVDNHWLIFLLIYLFIVWLLRLEIREACSRGLGLPRRPAGRATAE